ncbi:MAG TPA: hypothetical protein VM099_13340 [Gemmatimonadaceae bacterium]|nr:hypothetical protein [Gemmatimonadaceae bacterium]
MRPALSLTSASLQRWANPERVAACIAGLLLLNYFCWVVLPGTVLPVLVTAMAIFFSIGYLCWEVSQGRLFVTSMVVGGFFLLFFSPPVDWDARSIWFYHARRMFFDRALTPRLDGYAGMHASYPDLLPAVFASIARIGGVWNEFLPKPGLLLGMLPPFIILIARCKTTSTRLLMLGALLFVADRQLLNGYMDVPLALYVVAVIVLLREAAARTDSDSLWAPIIVLIAASASIKDEGAVMAAILGVPFAVIVVRRAPGAHRLARIFLIAAVAAIPLIVWKQEVYAAGLGLDFLDNPLGIARVRFASHQSAVIVRAIWENVSKPIGVLLLLAIIRKRIDPTVTWFFACYACLLFMIYLVTPYDLRWHLATSVDRVTLVFSLLAVAVTVMELEA